VLTVAAAAVVVLAAATILDAAVVVVVVVVESFCLSVVASALFFLGFDVRMIGGAFLIA
jgi:hypothetical protein